VADEVGGTIAGLLGDRYRWVTDSASRSPAECISDAVLDRPVAGL
jgi:hypothetical protein